METVVINGTLRTELGKKATRALRRAGNVPCNIYGGTDTLNFYAPLGEFRKLIFTPEFRLAEINLEGKVYKALVKDSQYAPVNDELLHLDFQELVDGIKVKAYVPLRLNGTPKGIVLGGKLEVSFRKLHVFALPKDLPTTIEIDIADMDLGAVKRIKDIQLEGVKLLHAPLNPFVKLTIPRAAKDAVAAAAATPKPAAAAAKPAAAAAKK